MAFKFLTKAERMALALVLAGSYSARRAFNISSRCRFRYPDTSSDFSRIFFVKAGKSLMSPADNAAALFSWSTQPSSVAPSNSETVIGEWVAAAGLEAGVGTAETAGGAGDATGGASAGLEGAGPGTCAP